MSRDKEAAETIADRTKAVISDHLGTLPDKVTPEAKFIDDLGADSLDMIELVMAFEEEFNIEIPDSVAQEIITVKEANDYLAKRLEA